MGITHNDTGYPDTAILTKHKINYKETAFFETGVGAEIKLENGLKVRFVCVHLDYKSYGPYAAFNKLVTNVSQILAGETSKYKVNLSIEDVCVSNLDIDDNIIIMLICFQPDRKTWMTLSKGTYFKDGRWSLLIIPFFWPETLIVLQIWIGEKIKSKWNTVTEKIKIKAKLTMLIILTRKI